MIHSERFIPGYAGNAVLRYSSSRESAVYPRLRGERHPVCRDICNHGGLSPATRGTPPDWLESVAGIRFIPGYAGNAFHF